jgi:hypothetical protein
MMGHPWKKKRAKPGMMDQEAWGALYPLVENGTISRLIEIGKQRRRISDMKQNCLMLQEKTRLLKRKISESNRQGEEYGKSQKFG